MSDGKFAGPVDEIPENVYDAPSDPNKVQIRKPMVQQKVEGLAAKNQYGDLEQLIPVLMKLLPNLFGKTGPGAGRGPMSKVR